MDDWFYCTRGGVITITLGFQTIFCQYLRVFRSFYCLSFSPRLKFSLSMIKYLYVILSIRKTLSLFSKYEIHIENLSKSHIFSPKPQSFLSKPKFILSLKALKLSQKLSRFFSIFKISLSLSQSFKFSQFSCFFFKDKILPTIQEPFLSISSVHSEKLIFRKITLRCLIDETSSYKRKIKERKIPICFIAVWKIHGDITNRVESD